MAFQEPVDPFIEKLQVLIDDLKENISDREFEKILMQIYEEFPFVDLVEFLEMYVNGEYAKVLIEKFHLLGYNDYDKLLQILKINKKRRTDRKNSNAKKINLEDNKLSKRYKILDKVLTRFQKSIKNKMNYNTLRAVVILQLITNEKNYTNKEKILQLLPNSINDFEHLVNTTHKPLSTINDEKINELIEAILEELKENFFLEINSSNNFRLESHQLLISEYMFNTIQNREGITHQELMISIKEKLPILSQIPSALFEMTLDDLRINNKIIKNKGYEKWEPFFDQYFTFENYRKIISGTDSFRKNRKFFGRKITPEKFITELVELEKGDFEDQDDQVTRIAGMILTNSNMMSHPPNELEDFDFAVNLSNYEFTKEQQQVIQNLNLEINSNTIYIKIMINKKITTSEISDLIFKLKARRQNEQGFIISFAGTEKLVEHILENNKIIQIISKRELEEWCKITPIIPSRRGAVAIIRQSDNRGSIVKIKSINYESGRADVILLPKMEENTQYIGALEEITLSVNIKKFVDYSNMYFQFLDKLYQISETDILKKVISDKSFISSRLKTPQIVIVPDQYIECIFEKRFKTKIRFDVHPDKSSLRYSIDDLFSCTCFQWNQKSRTNGLCDHLIFTLNESVKKILSSENTSYKINTEQHLKKIEQRMDLLLNRFRYTNQDISKEAKCPHCGITAHNLTKVKNVFGYRQMDKDDKFSLRRQSRCKKCR